MRRVLIVVAAVALAGGGIGAATLPRPALSPGLTKIVDPVIDALWSRFDVKAAADHVKFVSQYWRLPGNPGFDATIDRVHARLLASGFSDRVPGAANSTSAPDLHIEEYPNPTKGWDHTIGTLAIVRAGRPDEVVLSHEQERIALCINSFSTVPEGVTAKLVDVGKGDQESDYANRDVAGAVVMGDADVAQLWRRAVAGHGAIGVVSGAFGEYVNPDPPGAPPTPRESWDVLQWGSIPYDEARKGFGFKATPRAMTSLRKALSGGSANVRVTIASTFSAKPARTLVAEIPGRVAPAERVIVAVHVQEPGANDNASGVATLAEAARALAQGIAQGKIAPPGRTLTFLWLDEIAGSRQWLTDHPDQAKHVRYMFSIDMAGEDVRKTGGSFLIERYPDPGAVWDRAWDPHTEWGRGEVRADSLKGDLLNDLHLAMCLRVARKGGWVVNTNPYEGGSDHTVFGTAGIPAVLDWHFTDRYYHTNLDTADKSSATEMRNVGVAAVSTAWLLASAKEPAALAIAEVVANAGRARVAFEEREGARLAAADANPTAARLKEDQIVSAWKKWYGEAVLSASRVIVGPASEAFRPKLEALAAPFTDAITKPGARKGTPAMFSSVSPPISAPRIVLASSARATQIGPTVEGLELALDRLHADRWYPPLAVTAKDMVEDEALVRTAVASSDPALRRVAVRGLGQFERPDEVAALETMLKDHDLTVRAEAANAIAQSLVHTKGPAVVAAAQVLMEAERLSPAELSELFGIAPINGRITFPPDVQRLIDAMEAVFNDALSRMHYDNLQVEASVLNRLKAFPNSAVVLLRNDPKVPVTDDERRLLRSEAAPDARSIQPANPSAIEALGLIGDTDTRIVTEAMSAPCRLTEELCWPTRYAAVERMDATNVLYAGSLSIARHDSAFQVRMAAIRKYAAAIPSTHECSHILDALDDVGEVAIVQIYAISLLNPTCKEEDDIRAHLVALVGGLGTAADGQWQVDAAALEALPKFDRDEATRAVNTVALASGFWQVHAAAARTAAALQKEDLLLRFADDSESNVRTVALAGLVRLKSQSVMPLALRALESPDYQLVRQGALALQGNSQTEIVVPAILAALDRLTQESKDTSRDPRTALFQRLKDLSTPNAAGESPLSRWRNNIGPYLSDFDPSIASLAADVLGALDGTRPVPTPTRRTPEQPSEADLKSLPHSATVTMADGRTICMNLLVAEAPLSVARFVALANSGYYDGLTFHRLVPLFVAQGGSPGANEYMGDARYMRDEITLEHHTRGAVGISTRGRDTGDAQIFFDLVDQPRLNYDYTVFAHVSDGLGCVGSLANMDRLLEGAKIAGVTFRR